MTMTNHLKGITIEKQLNKIDHLSLLDNHYDHPLMKLVINHVANLIQDLKTTITDGDKEDINTKFKVNRLTRLSSDCLGFIDTWLLPTCIKNECDPYEKYSHALEKLFGVKSKAKAAVKKTTVKKKKPATYQINYNTKQETSKAVLMEVVAMSPVNGLVGNILRKTVWIPKSQIQSNGALPKEDAEDIQLIPGQNFAVLPTWLIAKNDLWFATV